MSSDKIVTLLCVECNRVFGDTCLYQKHVQDAHNDIAKPRVQIQIVSHSPNISQHAEDSDGSARTSTNSRTEMWKSDVIEWSFGGTEGSSNPPGASYRFIPLNAEPTFNTPRQSPSRSFQNISTNSQQQHTVTMRDDPLVQSSMLNPETTRRHSVHNENLNRNLTGSTTITHPHIVIAPLETVTEPVYSYPSLPMSNQATVSTASSFSLRSLLTEEVITKGQSGHLSRPSHFRPQLSQNLNRFSSNASSSAVRRPHTVIRPVGAGNTGEGKTATLDPINQIIVVQPTEKPYAPLIIAPMETSTSELIATRDVREPRKVTFNKHLPSQNLKRFSSNASSTQNLNRFSSNASSTSLGRPHTIIRPLGAGNKGEGITATLDPINQVVVVQQTEKPYAPLIIAPMETSQPIASREVRELKNVTFKKHLPSQNLNRFNSNASSTVVSRPHTVIRPTGTDNTVERETATLDPINRVIELEKLYAPVTIAPVETSTSQPIARREVRELKKVTFNKHIRPKLSHSTATISSLRSTKKVMAIGQTVLVSKPSHVKPQVCQTLNRFSSNASSSAVSRPHTVIRRLGTGNTGKNESATIDPINRVIDLQPTEKPYAPLIIAPMETSTSEPTARNKPIIDCTSGNMTSSNQREVSKTPSTSEPITRNTSVMDCISSNMISSNQREVSKEASTSQPKARTKVSMKTLPDDDVTCIKTSTRKSRRIAERKSAITEQQGGANPDTVVLPENTSVLSGNPKISCQMCNQVFLNIDLLDIHLNFCQLIPQIDLTNDIKPHDDAICSGSNSQNDTANKRKPGREMVTSRANPVNPGETTNQDFIRDDETEDEETMLVYDIKLKNDSFDELTAKQTKEKGVSTEDITDHEAMSNEVNETANEQTMSVYDIRPKIKTSNEETMLVYEIKTDNDTCSEEKVIVTKLKNTGSGLSKSPNVKKPMPQIRELQKSSRVSLRHNSERDVKKMGQKDIGNTVNEIVNEEAVFVNEGKIEEMIVEESDSDVDPDEIPETSYSCDICKGAFLTEEALKVHTCCDSFDCDSVIFTRFKCTTCGRTIHGKRKWIYHALNHRTAEMGLMYCCHICCKSLNSRHKFKTHMHVHKNSNETKPLINVLAEEENIKFHIKSEYFATGAYYRCRHCKLLIEGEEGIRTHVLTHTHKETIETYAEKWTKKKKRKGAEQRHQTKLIQPKTTKMPINPRKMEPPKNVLKFSTLTIPNELLFETGYSIVKYGYICTKCSQFLTQDKLLVHSLAHRNEFPKTVNKMLKVRKGWSDNRKFLFQKNADFTVHVVGRMMMNNTDEAEDPIPYKCCFCDKVYKTEVAARIHAWTHKLRKAGKGYKCPLCDTTHKGYGPMGASQHLAAHFCGIESYFFQCTKCDKQMFLLDVAEKHVASHKKPVLECTCCLKRFSTKRALRRHRKLHKAQKGCGNQDVVEREVGEYIIVNQNRFRFYVPLNQKTIHLNKGIPALKSHHSSNRENLDGFHRITRTLRKYCRVCRLRCCCQQLLLLKHEQMKHQVKLYTCADCGLKFNYVGVYQIHLERHSTGNNGFQCNQCDSTFLLHKTLKQHQTIHENQKRRHLIETLNNSEACSYYAKKTVGRKNEMVQQTLDVVKLNTGKSHWCRICKMSFNKSVYNSHMLIHTRITRFPCLKCGRLFSDHNKLKLHHTQRNGCMRLHQCSICDRKFKAKFLLEKHMLVHTKKTSWYASKLQHLEIINKDRSQIQYLEMKSREDGSKDGPVQSDDSMNQPPPVQSDDRMNQLPPVQTDDRMNQLPPVQTDDGMNQPPPVQTDPNSSGDSSFSSSGNTLKNPHTAASGVSYICDVCGQGFTELAPLESHRLSHTEYRYRCQYCGKGKQFLNKLYIHEKRHLGEFPVMCDHCALCFKDENSLEQHMVVEHAGLKDKDHESKKDATAEASGTRDVDVMEQEVIKPGKNETTQGIERKSRKRGLSTQTEETESENSDCIEYAGSDDSENVDSEDEVLTKIRKKKKRGLETQAYDSKASTSSNSQRENVVDELYSFEIPFTTIQMPPCKYSRLSSTSDPTIDASE